ncbi:MAG: hypothetical protein ABEH43_04000, partial [Flavobacteriales bacterium]
PTISPTIRFTCLPKIEEICIGVNGLGKPLDGNFINDLIIKECPNLKKIDFLKDEETIIKQRTSIGYCILDAPTYYGAFYNNSNKLVKKTKDVYITY